MLLRIIWILLFMLWFVYYWSFKCTNVKYTLVLCCFYCWVKLLQYFLNLLESTNDFNFIILICEYFSNFLVWRDYHFTLSTDFSHTTNSTNLVLRLIYLSMIVPIDSVDFEISHYVNIVATFLSIKAWLIPNLYWKFLYNFVKISSHYILVYFQL